LADNPNLPSVDAMHKRGGESLCVELRDIYTYAEANNISVAEVLMKAIEWNKKRQN